MRHHVSADGGGLWRLRRPPPPHASINSFRTVVVEAATISCTLYLILSNLAQFMHALFLLDRAPFVFLEDKLRFINQCFLDYLHPPSGILSMMIGIKSLKEINYISRGTILIE